jgi:hypothetical protein
MAVELIQINYNNLNKVIILDYFSIINYINNKFLYTF